MSSSANIHNDSVLFSNSGFANRRSFKSKPAPLLNRLFNPRLSLRPETCGNLVRKAVLDSACQLPATNCVESTKLSIPINNFNLIELFICLKKNVLWLKISMNNMIFMAIVYASKNLINEHSSVFLTEFTFCDDFIE